MQKLDRKMQCMLEPREQAATRRDKARNKCRTKECDRISLAIHANWKSCR